MRLALSVGLMTLVAAPALACGPDSDCRIGDRSYRYYAPEGVDGSAGAFFFAHGYRGSGEGAMRNQAFYRLAERLGLVFVALDSEGPDWALAHTPQAPTRDSDEIELAYVAEVIDDLAARMPLDRDRLVASGFSAGGMLTWTLACSMSESFAGFVPMSGTFWAPVPAECPSQPATLIHIHGTADTTVPLGGRPIGPTRQGDVPEALAMYAADGGFAPTGEIAGPGGMSCTTAANPGGQTLEFCLFEGGHSFSAERLEWAINRILDGA